MMWKLAPNKEQDKKGLGYVVIDELTKKTICTVHDVIGMTAKEVLDNATLIASAPEMLVLLKKVKEDYFDTDEEEPNGRFDTLFAIKKLIEKLKN